VAHLIRAAAPRHYPRSSHPEQHALPQNRTTRSDTENTLAQGNTGMHAAVRKQAQSRVAP
jgi:hypothetical protein